MRLRDNPRGGIVRAVRCSPTQAWGLATGVSLPAAVEGGLQRVGWLDGGAAVAEPERRAQPL